VKVAPVPLFTATVQRFAAGTLKTVASLPASAREWIVRRLRRNGRKRQAPHTTDQGA
jgi:hypothetical protein